MTNEMIERVAKAIVAAMDKEGYPYNSVDMRNAVASAATAEVLAAQPMETAPRDGTEFLALAEWGWFITAYRPDDVKGSGFGSIHSCCGYYEDQKPTAWVPLPPIKKP